MLVTFQYKPIELHCHLLAIIRCSWRVVWAVVARWVPPQCHPTGRMLHLLPALIIIPEPRPQLRPPTYSVCSVVCGHPLYSVRTLELRACWQVT